MKSKNKTLQLLGFIALAGFSAPAVHAANDVWLGNTNANFATLTNWTGSVNPNNNTPVFGAAGSAGIALNNDIVGATYAGLTFNSGASAFTITGNSFTLTGNIVNNSTNTQTINTPMTIAATRTVNATSGQLVLGGNITGAAGLTLNPINKITLAGTNNFATGGSFSNLTVNGGAGGVDITGSTTLGNGGATNANGYLSVGGNVTVTIQSGGSLTVNGSTAATPTSAIGQNIAGTSTLLVNGGTLTFGTNTGLLLANGSSGNAVLTISSGTATINRGTVATTGAGTETRLIQMGRDGTGTGTINLNGGTLATSSQFVRDGSTGAGSGTANFVFGGGTLKALGTQTDWLQSTTASSAGQNQGATGGTVNTGALALSSVTTTAVSTIDSNSFSVAINNAVSGAGGFTVIDSSGTGTGVVTFGGVNTYSGATAVNSGKLALAAGGSIANTSGVSLGNGGTFDVAAKGGAGYTVNNLTGSGTVVGSLSVSTQLAIGNSPGTTAFDNLTLGAASTYLFDVTGGVAPGVDSADLGNVSGSLTLVSGTVLDLVQLGTYTQNNKFTLFGYTTGSLLGTFKDTTNATLADGATFTDGGGIWTIDYDDTTAGANGGIGTRFVTVTAIPEPASVLLGGFGLLALLRRRRVR